MSRKLNWRNLGIFALGLIVLDAVIVLTGITDPLITIIGSFVYGFTISSIFPWVDYSY